MTHAEVKNKMGELIDRTGILKPVTIHMEDDKRILCIPNGLQINDTGVFYEVLDEQTGKTVLIPAAKITDIVG